TILRHVLWRTRNFFVWEFSPGGATYTFLWRLLHPRAFVRPLMALLARFAGWAASWLKTPRRAGAPAASASRTSGVSVVIPSRNGKELLATVLPEVLDQSPADIIVVDNGSTDGTADFLRAAYPTVRIESSAEPLSFARAVNTGIRSARFSHVCLLN